MQDSMAGDAHASSRNTRFAILVTLAFLGVTIPVLLRHEMWRDEVQAWLLARDAGSIATMLHLVRYEGHPASWYAILRLVSRFTHDPRAVQWVSLGFAAAAAYVIARYAPFTRAQRVLAAFGYFVVYGYSVVARSYSLEMLLAFVACALVVRRRGGRNVALGVTLFLLANTTVYGALLAAALACALALEALARGAGARFTSGAVRGAALPVVLGVAGVIVSYAQVRPPADSWYHNYGETATATPDAPRESIVSAYRLSPVWRAYVPIPYPEEDIADHQRLWYTNFLTDRGPHATLLAVVLSGVLVVTVALIIRRSLVALAFYVIATGVLGAFTLLIYWGTLYHHGHLFLALLMALWIAAGDQTASAAVPATRARTPLRWLDSHSAIVVSALLVTQVVGGAVRLVGDYLYEFSAGKAVAEFIRDRLPPSSAVAVYPGFRASTISAYLGRPLFDPSHNRYITYARFDIEPAHFTPPALLALLQRCCTAHGAIVLALDRALPPHDLPAGVTPLATFSGTMGNEDYFLYLVRKPPGAPATTPGSG